VLKRLILLSLFGLLALSPAGAQYKMRVVSGIVTDMRGNPLARVAVQLENTRNLSVRSYITREDGRFNFNDLNDDIDFTLRARYRNWSSKLKTIGKLDSSTHPEVTLVIAID
jgi:hypothetical protein